LLVGGKIILSHDIVSGVVKIVNEKPIHNWLFII
jgi:hypothetical protein